MIHQLWVETWHRISHFRTILDRSSPEKSRQRTVRRLLHMVALPLSYASLRRPRSALMRGPSTPPLLEQVIAYHNTRHVRTSNEFTEERNQSVPYSVSIQSSNKTNQLPCACRLPGSHRTDKYSKAAWVTTQLADMIPGLFIWKWNHSGASHGYLRPRTLLLYPLVSPTFAPRHPKPIDRSGTD